MRSKALNMSDWDFYKANINDKISSVYLNLEACSEIDTTKYSKLCWLFIRLKIKRIDGLSHDDEYEALIEYEDNLIAYITKIPQIDFVGRITTDGMRQFYFYATNELDFEFVINEFLDKAPSYQFQLGFKNDPEWNQYKNTLYPGINGLQQIRDRRKNA